MSQARTSRIEYLSFFGFSVPPFPLMTDTSIFYPASTHIKALELLSFAIDRGDKVVLLHGKPGTGKTHLLIQLTRSLSDTVKTSLITCAPLTFTEFPVFLLETLGMDIPIRGIGNTERLYEAVEKALVENGCPWILIFDEAHLLTDKSLEIVKGFFNLKHSEYIQVLLSGSDELKETLSRNALLSLSQRISAIVEIQPMSKDETKNYIFFRIANCGGTVSFEEEVFDRIFSITQGIPRQINRFMDRLLLIGYAEKTLRIGLDLVNKAQETFEEQKGKKRIWSFFRKRDRVWDHRLGLLEDQLGYYKREFERLERELTGLQENLKTIMSEAGSSQDSHDDLRKIIDYRFSELEASIEERLNVFEARLSKGEGSLEGRYSKFLKDCEERLEALEAAASSREDLSFSLTLQEDIVTKHQLETLAVELKKDLNEKVAQRVNGLRGEYEQEVMRVRGEFQGFEEEVKRNFSQLKMELKKDLNEKVAQGVNGLRGEYEQEVMRVRGEFQGFEEEVKRNFSQLKNELNILEQGLRRLGSLSQKDIEKVKHLFAQSRVRLENRLSRTEKAIGELQKSIQKQLHEAQEELANGMRQDAKRLEKRIEKLEQRQENPSRLAWYGVLEKM